MIKRCGLYIRVSTDLQAKEIEGSLKTQRQRLDEAITHRKSPDCQWVIAKVYEERGRSGKDTNRPEFQQLLRDISDGLIDVVLCTELSRISRSVIDFLKFVEFLQAKRCDFLCLKEHFDTTTAHGKLLITVSLALAQFERELVSERTKAAIFARAKRGLWNGGSIPGYDRDPNRKGYLTINPQEAELVRLIFNLYLEHGSYGKVRDIIAEKGYRTKEFTSRSGRFHPTKPFLKNDIAYILQNTHYIGLKEVNKCRKHQDQAQLKPEERYQLVKGTHEPIVDGTVFQRVQALIKRNGRTHHSFAETTRHVYLLGNERVHCGECQSVMTTSWSKGRQRTYPYYLCTAVDKAGARSCGIRRVSAEALDGIVLRRVRRIAQSPKLCGDLVASTNRLFVKELGPLRQRRAALTRALGEVDSQAKQLVAKLVSNGCENLYYVREALADFEERRKQLELEVATVETAIQQHEGQQIEPEVVQRGLVAFDQVLDELTPAERRRVFELLVREVVYTPTHITLTLYELPFVERGDVKASWFDERKEWLGGAVTPTSASAKKEPTAEGYSSLS